MESVFDERLDGDSDEEFDYPNRKNLLVRV